MSAAWLAVQRILCERGAEEHVFAARALAFAAINRVGCTDVAAALVHSLSTHAGSSDVCLYASWALLNLDGSDPLHRAAILAAGAVAPLAAALARHPGAAREKAHLALEKLGYTDTGALK